MSASHSPLDRVTQTQRPASRRDVLRLGAGFAAGAAVAGCAAPAGETSVGPDDTSGMSAGERADNLFPELSDQTHTEEPIGPDERATRRQRLAGLLASRGIDALFCEGGATMTYLSGVSWGHSERVFGLLVLADGSHAWVCPAFEAERAKLSVGGEGGPGGEIVTWEEHEYARHALTATFEQRDVRSVAIDPAARVLALDELRLSAMPEDSIRSGREVVGALRAVKDDHELALLRRANELTQQAIVAASQHVTVGMTGEDIAHLMRAAQQKLGLSRVWVLALVGPAAAYPHGGRRSATLGEGDFLLVDTGGSLHGYQSDNTRTWVPAGKPDEKQLRVWNIVRDAQRRAYDAIRPGRRCGEIDRVARDVIDAAGFGPDYRTFTHRLGHGIGMQGHEDPYFDLGSEVVLEPGMTLSNEPGIYLYDEFGVRLEDIVAVTETGADHFGNWQAGPGSPSSRLA